MVLASTWQEIGEEFVEFLEKELNITDPDAEEEKAQNNNAYSGAEGMGSGTQNKATDKRNNIEENLDDIEAALAQLKKELGLWWRLYVNNSSVLGRVIGRSSHAARSCSSLHNLLYHYS